ncbi:MAG: abortive infection system antitoxin AbiGi family protein [Thermodesulfobacteriota bacterium]
MENEFCPHYCIEKIPLNKKTLDAAFPMVCFCDIPLSQAKEHITKYGKYGIGLSKSWGRRNGLNPVLYLRRNSNLTNSFEAILVGMKEGIKSESDIPNALKNVMRYLKPYVGNHIRGLRKRNRIRFYNEREWRYVPPVETPHIRFALGKEDYTNQETMKQADSILEDVKLRFEPGDIKYVIVKKEEEILETVKALSRIKGKKYGKETVLIVVSRVITCDQILKDF